MKIRKVRLTSNDDADVWDITPAAALTIKPDTGSEGVAIDKSSGSLTLTGTARLIFYQGADESNDQWAFSPSPDYTSLNVIATTTTPDGKYGKL